MPRHILGRRLCIGAILAVAVSAAAPSARSDSLVLEALQGTSSDGFFAAWRLDPAWAQLVNPAENHINGMAVMHEDLLVFNYKGDGEGRYNKVMTVNRDDSNWQIEDLPKMKRGKDYASGMDAEGPVLVLADTSRVHIFALPFARNPKNHGISNPDHVQPGILIDNILHQGYVKLDGQDIPAEFVGIAFYPPTDKYYLMTWRGSAGFRLFEAIQPGKSARHMIVREVTLDAGSLKSPEGGLNMIFDAQSDLPPAKSLTVM